MDELELICHPQIEGISVFFDTVEYRTPHLHPEIELVWVQEGRLEVCSGQSGFLANPGDLLLFNSESPHEFRSTETGCTFLCLQISLKCFSMCYPAIERTLFADNFPARHLTADEMADLKRDFSSLARAYIEQIPCCAVFCQAQAGRILYRLLTRVPVRVVTAAEAADIHRRNARLGRFIAFVDENYQNKILLSDFARQEKRSVSYLSHFLKNTLNQTFQEYVSSVRFHAACQLIRQGKRMLDVCVEAGFSDYRYFVRAFRKNVGQTPEAYSRSLQPPALAPSAIHRSLRSLEKFYSREESLQLLERFRL